MKSLLSVTIMFVSITFAISNRTEVCHIERKCYCQFSDSRYIDLEPIGDVRLKGTVFPWTLHYEIQLCETFSVRACEHVLGCQVPFFGNTFSIGSSLSFVTETLIELLNGTDGRSSKITLSCSKKQKTSLQFINENPEFTYNFKLTSPTVCTQDMTTIATSTEPTTVTTATTKTTDLTTVTTATTNKTDPTTGTTATTNKTDPTTGTTATTNKTDPTTVTTATTNKTDPTTGTTATTNKTDPTTGTTATTNKTDPTTGTTATTNKTDPTTGTTATTNKTDPTTGTTATTNITDPTTVTTVTTLPTHLTNMTAASIETTHTTSSQPTTTTTAPKCRGSTLSLSNTLTMWILGILTSNLIYRHIL